MHYIYSLEHPITNEIRYIGRTNNLRLRINRHNSSYGITHKENWVKSLKKENLKPIIKVIEEFENEKDCFNAEIYWIAQFKAWGFNLTNNSIGGENSRLGSKMSTELRKRISDSLKELYKTKERSNKGKKLSEEHKEALRKAHKHIPNYGFKGKKHTSILKKVEVYKDNILIDTLNSILETSKKYNINPGSISNICLGKAKRSKGYTFKYPI